MQVRELEELSARLERLRDRLRSSSPSDAPLGEDNPLVQAAMECDFMLPATLNVRTLAETVDRKIANVSVLLERARKHEDLPEAVQAEADQEYSVSEDDHVPNTRG